MPTITREVTSRPNWSVPIQCSSDGAAKRSATFCSSGGYGVSPRAASTATTTSSPTITDPISPPGVCHSRRSRPADGDGRLLDERRLDDDGH